MNIKESIAYLRPIADSAHLKQYAAALETAIRCMEETEALQKELEQVKRERNILLGEKCYECGFYRILGGCDHCRWNERRSELWNE